MREQEPQEKLRCWVVVEKPCSPAFGEKEWIKKIIPVSAWFDTRRKVYPNNSRDENFVIAWMIVISKERSD